MKSNLAVVLGLGALLALAAPVFGPTLWYVSTIDKSGSEGAGGPTPTITPVIPAPTWIVRADELAMQSLWANQHGAGSYTDVLDCTSTGCGFNVSLSTGALSMLGNLDVSGTVTAHGNPTSGVFDHAVTFSGAVTFNGSTTFTGGAGAFTVSSLTDTGSATIATTLGVTGVSTFGTVNAGAVSGSSLAATGDASGATVTTGESDIRHATRTYQIPAAAMIATDGAWTAPLKGAPWWLPASGGVTINADAAIEVPVGDKITTVRVYVQDGTSATLISRTFVFRLFKHAASGTTPVQVGGTINGAGAISTFETMTLSSLTETTVSGTQYYLQIGPADTTTSTAEKLMFAEVDTTRP